MLAEIKNIQKYIVNQMVFSDEDTFHKKEISKNIIF